MTTPIVDMMDALATLWTGLTPPDRTSVTYHHLDQAEPQTEWVVLDRGFRFDLPQRSVPAAAAADRTKTLVEWVVAVTFHVARRGRGFLAYAKAVANETAQLAFAAESKTSWPTGISEVFIEALETQDEPEGAIATFTFTVLCEDS